MLGKTKAYSGFAVNDLARAKEFYGGTLGIDIEVLSEEGGLIQLELEGGNRPTLVYAKDDLDPANYTILNFPVDDIDVAVDALSGKGVEFERYEGFDQDEKGIARGNGPDIAWFKDPAGNILSVLRQPD